MAAAVDGTLAISSDGAHCLVIVGGSRDVTMVAWPQRFSMVLAPDGKVEIRGDGMVFRQGEEVRLGGGEIKDGVHHSIEGACIADRYFAAETFP